MGGGDEGDKKGRRNRIVPYLWVKAWMRFGFRPTLPKQGGGETWSKSNHQVVYVGL